MTEGAGPRDLVNRALKVRQQFTQVINSVEAELRTEEGPDRQLELVTRWRELKKERDSAHALAEAIGKQCLDLVHQELVGRISQMEAVSAAAVSEDNDVTVTVDALGQLTDLWLKPGIFEGKSAGEIAAEITRLVTTAGQQTAEEISAIFEAAYDLPGLDTVIAQQGNSPAAEPETAPQPR